MNKSELVVLVKEVVASKVGENITNVKAQEIVKEVFETIKESLVKNGEVILPEIGKLKVVETAARKGTITKKDGTKQDWEKPAGKKVKLVVGKPLKESL